MLQRVRRRPGPAHGFILGTGLHPPGRLVASHRTHVVGAFRAVLVDDLGYAGRRRHLVEPSSEAVREYVGLLVGCGVGLDHHVDEPVPLAGDQPYVVHPGLGQPLVHRRGVVYNAPALVGWLVVCVDLLIVDDMGGLIGPAAGDDGEV